MHRSDAAEVKKVLALGVVVAGAVAAVVLLWLWPKLDPWGDGTVPPPCSSPSSKGCSGHAFRYAPATSLMMGVVLLGCLVAIGYVAPRLMRRVRAVIRRWRSKPENRSQSRALSE